MQQDLDNDCQQLIAYYGLMSAVFCSLFTLSNLMINLSNLMLASRTATTLSVTWPAGYPKCYSFTVSHSIPFQDDSINVSQPADSDTSHTLTSLQPGTTYRIEVEVVRKGDGADGQRAKVMGNFTTKCEGEGILLNGNVCRPYRQDYW